MYKKSLIMAPALCLAMLGLTGCLTELRSMGTYPMPAAHQPRTAPDSKDAETVVSADGFAILNQGWSNTDQVYGGGGFVSAIHRLGGMFSPVFGSVTIGGYGGNVNFSCDYDKDCGDDYLAWLKTGEDRYDQSFWAIQERLMFGFEFNTPINVFFGLGGGIFIYQSGGDYDDVRKEVAWNFREVESRDDTIEGFFFGSIWLGFHIGKNAKYGSVSANIDMSSAYLSNYKISLPLSVGYYHPSGFHGGIQAIGYGVDVFFGKSFRF